MNRYRRGATLRHLDQNAHPLGALFACFLAVLLTITASAGETATNAMTLSLAAQRVLAQNPELQIYHLRDVGLQGLSTTAQLSPPLELAAEAENVGGSNDFNGADSAELTLSLSSVIELGGKQQARVTAIDAQRQLAGVELQIAALDLLAEVTRRFVEIVASQARLELAVDDRQFAALVLQSVAHRTQVGAAPDAELLRARAQLALAELAVSEAQYHLQTAGVSLAVMWGDSEADFVRVEGDLLNLGAIEEFNTLYARAMRNPAIELFASEARLREAQLQLAKTQSSTDVTWSVGIRQFQDTNDTALVAGLSIPLNTAVRNAGALQSAKAARNEVEVRREATLRNLRAHLFDVYQQRKLGSETAATLQSEVIPVLSQALQQTRAAYESGHYSYQEWMAAREELVAAQSALIGAASMSLLSGATIEQLTSEPLILPLAHNTREAEQE